MKSENEELTEIFTEEEKLSALQNYQRDGLVPEWNGENSYLFRSLVSSDSRRRNLEGSIFDNGSVLYAGKYKGQSLTVKKGEVYAGDSVLAGSSFTENVEKKTAVVTINDNTYTLSMNFKDYTEKKASLEKSEMETLQIGRAHV